MSTYRELVYMVHDEMKRVSDDAFYTDEHVIFLLNKFRSYILKREYSSAKKEINGANYQEICLALQPVEAIPGLPCLGSYVRSVEKIPEYHTFSNTQVYPVDFYKGNIVFTSMEKMRFVGRNKWTHNIIYASMGPDNYLYFTSQNPQFMYLRHAKMYAVFDDASEAADLSCDAADVCDILDKEFPLESSFVTYIIELCVKELAQGAVLPADDINTGDDNGPAIQGNLSPMTRKETQRPVTESISNQEKAKQQD